MDEFESPAAAAAAAASEPAKGRNRKDDNASLTPLGLRKGATVAAEGATKDGDGGGAKSGRPGQRGSALRGTNSGDDNIDADGSLDSGGGGGGESSPFGQVWFETTMSKLKDLGGDGSRVAGVHVMAPGPGPRGRAEALVRAGVFGKR